MIDITLTNLIEQFFLCSYLTEFIALITCNRTPKPNLLESLEPETSIDIRNNKISQKLHEYKE